MNNGEILTNSDIVALLAERVRQYRLAERMSQDELAAKSGVSKSTICHFEQGANPNITLNNFVALLRAMGMEQNFEDLLPELPVPPMALREMNKFMSKRVRRKNG